jgi:hypothetical protein
MPDDGCVAISSTDVRSDGGCRTRALCIQVVADRNEARFVEVGHGDAGTGGVEFPCESATDSARGTGHDNV